MNEVLDTESVSESSTHYSLDGLVTLLELSRDISMHLDLDMLLRRVEAAALHVLDCERLTVFLNEPLANDLRSRLATGGREIRTPADRGIAGAAFREGHMINVEDARADPRFNDAIDRQTGFRTQSLLAVPLRGINNETIGVLQLLNKRNGIFTDTDETLALTLGSLTGITLQRQILFDHYREKQRIEHDLQLARNIQRSLLPATYPQIPGFDIVAWTQEADATGGDFYDFFDLSDGRLGIVVADVAGHGLAASLLACEARALIRAAAASTMSIVEIVTRTNAQLYRDLQNERFVVLFLAALEAATGRLEFVGAGCAPMVYRQTENRFIPTEATVPPLGVLPTLQSDFAREMTLHAGDALVMMTDGLYEWENAEGQQFGMERLRESVRRSASRPGFELIRAVYQEVLAYAGGVPQVDDVTAMVTTRVP
jgi:sigma-B regulation protein RsbU (phosphoserine phosphatase)